MTNHRRILVERSIDGASGTRSTRSVTVNLTESPLGWLFARGFVTKRQFEAGERLRSDWERAELSPRVTMIWDAAPITSARSGSAPARDPRDAQIDARRRFHAAVDSAGPGLSDILWRVVCAGEGMREAETALGWPARAGKLVLSFCPRPNRDLLSDSLSGSVLAAYALVRRSLGFALCCGGIASVPVMITHGWVAEVVASLVLAAVAAHRVLS